MAKQSGLGDNFYVAGVNLSGDINSLGRIGGGPAALPLTGIDKFANERRGGKRDGSIEFVSYFNADTGKAHPTLKVRPLTNILATYFRGTALGNPAASVLGKQLNYDPTRDADGNLTIAVQVPGNAFGLEWGNSLTAGPRTDAAATNGAGVDFGTGPTAFGLQAYLHVFSFTGTDATIKIQESSDNAAVDPYADVVGGGFTAVTAAPFSQRIATASNLTVERWLRVVTTTVGGFSSLSFAVMVRRNPQSPEF